MIRCHTIVLTLLLAFSFATASFATEDDPFAWEWYEFDDHQNLRINLFVFTRSTCPKCPKAVGFISRLREKYPWLHVRQYEISQHAGNLELYRRMAASLHRPAGQVPALFYCRQLTVGYTSDRQTGRQIEANLRQCYEHLQSQLQNPSPTSQTAPASPSDSARVPWAGGGEFAGVALRPEVYLLAASLPAFIDVDQQPLPGVSPSQDATVAGDFASPDEERRTGFSVPGSAWEPQVQQALPDAHRGRTSDEMLSQAEPGKENAPDSKPFTVLPDEVDQVLPDKAPRQLPHLELPTLPPVAEETVDMPLVGQVDVDELSLPTFTVVLAGCDAFNPCAFFVLLSLLGMLIHARSRLRMVLVGGIFVLFSGLFYFLFMAAWLNLFFLAGHLQMITVIAGILAIVVAVINIKDYFLFHRGVSLSIPDSARPRLFERMRVLVAATQWTPLVLGTTALAVTANSYELLCTAGFPMVFTRVLTLRELPTSSYYGYLILYNLVYVVPLAVIVIAFTVTLGRRKLSEKEGRILKLLSGVMMLTLGVILLAAPAWLHNVLTAVALLAVALGLTLLIVLLDRLYHGITPHRAGQGRCARPNQRISSAARPN